MIFKTVSGWRTDRQRTKKKKPKGTKIPAIATS